MFNKVIVSHLGELTQDLRTQGDRVCYRIYYGRPAGLVNPELTIVDRVDSGLSHVTVFNDGVYDPATRTIKWVVPARRFKRKAFVEFEAQVAHTGTITNQASASGEGFRPVKSNVVQTTVNARPQIGWVPFADGARDGAPPRSYMKDETTTGITVRFDVPGLFIHEEQVDGVTYHHVSIPGHAAMAAVGKPELPVLGEMVEVPFDVDFSPEVVQSETVHLAGYSVYPAQPPRTEQTMDGGTQPVERPARLIPVRVAREEVFTVDAATYRDNAAFPAAPVTIASEDIGVIRGHRVLFLKVNPVQYNPVTRTVTVHTTIEVRIKYSHLAQLKGVNKRLHSRAFDELLRASLINYKTEGRLFSEGGSGKEVVACDYLIITHDAFYVETDPTNPVLRFANWKRRKGYRTNVVKVGSIPGGNTAASIQSYIKTAYDTWNPPPTYVLLIGDSDLVGAVAGLHHPDENLINGPQPQVETDLYYVTVDGSDYFPDIYIGRMSADTLQQVTDMVDKFINYEQNPPATPANAGFYSHATLIGLFADETPVDGREGRPWIANLETMRTFLQGQGYTVDRIYADDTGFPGNPNAQDPRRFNDGTNLPNDLISPNYAWNGGPTDIRNAINNGRFLVTYRAHGGWNGWAQPSFGIADATALVQSDLTPLVISVTCQTGWFDNETDDNAHGGRAVGDDCFAEVMLRRPRSGAIGMIGMTRNSSTGWNDFLVFGAYKAIWPAFDPNPPWAGHPAAPAGQQPALRRLGQIASFSKMYMARAYGADDTRKLEFEMHHLFGDPELPVWTRAPGSLAVNHPKAIGATGLQGFVVKVTDQANGQVVPNATVVLTRGSQIVQMQQTQTDGLARFGLDAVGDGDLDLTVSVLDYRPYLGTLAVTAKGGELNRLDPTNGPDNQVIHVGGRGFQAGENVDVYLGTSGPFTTAANGSGEFGQSVPTVDLTVPANSIHGLVNVTANGQTSHRAACRIFQVRDANPVDLYLYDQWNSSTWTPYPGDHPVWDNPDIQLYDASNNPVDSNNLVLGQTYTVKAKIHNGAAFPAASAKVVYKWANYGAGGPWQLLDTVSVDVPANPPGLKEAQTTFQPPATGHLCLQVNVEHVEDNDTTNNTGQENLHVGFSSSPAEACFTVWNLTREPGPVYFEVRQLFDPKAAKKVLWASRVKHPVPQILRPGDKATACVVVDPEKADVGRGASADFAVTCFIGGKMIGGVNVRIIKR
jgi:hypothetical protein